LALGIIEKRSFDYKLSAGIFIILALQLIRSKDPTSHLLFWQSSLRDDLQCDENPSYKSFRQESLP